MKKKAIMIAALVAAFSLPALRSQAQIWNFDSSAEGWSMHDFAGSGDYVTTVGTYAANWNATGGNPGGFISQSDQSGGSFFFQAPSADLGNYSGFSGGTFNFSLTTDQSTDFSNDAVVVFKGSASNLTIVAGISPLPNSSWTSYSIDLDPSNFHYDNLSGSIVSSSDFSGVMSDLTDLFIDGEYHNGISETSGLDSVSFMAPRAPGAVPEPSTYGLLAAAGLLGLACWRRRK